MVTVPTKLSDITLSQWVNFQNTYGQDLDNRAAKLTGDASEQLQYDLDYALCHYTFYTGVDVATITTEMLPDVLKRQNLSFAMLKAEDAELDYKRTFNWNGEEWKIAPVLRFAGRMTKAEFEISQDIALIYSDLQDGKHEAMFALCAAFMRKVGETYSSYLIDSNNERIKLMQSLPLDMVMCVKHYTEDSIKLYLESVKT